MSVEIGIFASRYINKGALEEVRELFGCSEKDIIYKIPKTPQDIISLPEKVALMGGDGTKRVFVRALYKLRESLKQRGPLLLVALDNHGTLSKVPRLLKLSNRKMNVEEIREAGGDYNQWNVPVAMVDEEPFFLDLSLGRFESHVWEWDGRLRARVPGAIRVPLRHALGLLSTVGQNGRGGFVFDTIFTNKIIGPKEVFQDQDFIYGKTLVRATVVGYGTEDLLKLGLTLAHLQLGIRPPSWALKVSFSPSFHIPSRVNPLALDGDLIEMPDSGRGIREVKRKGWEVPMVALA